MKLKDKIDLPVVLIPLFAILLACIFLVINFESARYFIDAAYKVVTKQFGFVYLWITLISFLLCLYLALGPYGKIKLGEGEKEYGEISWAAMIFCASMAAGFLYWTNIEWTFYYQSPPFGIEPMSETALEYAGAYPLFHWGPSAWGLYLIPAIAFGYSYYNRKCEHFDVASCCHAVFGKRHEKIIYRVINIIFVFGMVGGAGTTLGIGTPVATAALNDLFGLEDTGLVKFITLFVITCIFTASAYAGVKRGIKVLSNINVGFLLVIVALVFCFSDKIFVLKMATTSVGLLISDFFRMSTWMDPVMETGFVETWTVFYWAWWLSIALSVGLFIAKISRGRTIRGIILGCLGYGLAATFLFFTVFTGNAVSLTLKNVLNVPESMNSIGGPQTVMAILHQNPMSTLLVFLVLVASVILTATTYDSVSHTLAMVSAKNFDKEDDPPKKLSVFWAVSVAAIPAVLLLFDGSLQQIQTFTIVFTLPVCVLYMIITLSLFKMLHQDFKKK